ncbi:MAG: hypothetical protein NZ730_06640 [Porticoccaceae bacterium]|nr:hypothetical protein [Porticoccaceae bacterium]
MKKSDVYNELYALQLSLDIESVSYKLWAIERDCEVKARFLEISNRKASEAMGVFLSIKQLFPERPEANAETSKLLHQWHDATVELSNAKMEQGSK